MHSLSRLMICWCTRALSHNPLKVESVCQCIVLISAMFIDTEVKPEDKHLFSMASSRACRAKTEGEGVRNAEQDSQQVEVSRGSNQNKNISWCNKQHIWKKKKTAPAPQERLSARLKTLQYVSFPCKVSHNNEDEWFNCSLCTTHSLCGREHSKGGIYQNQAQRHQQAHMHTMSVNRGSLKRHVNLH